MAELSFDRKYRPSSLDDYLGDEIKNLVMNRLKNGDISTVLLYGERGCGKTTLARILARELLCNNKIDGKSCGHCEICTEINEKLIYSEAGVAVDGVVELDVGSDSGKSAIDEALDDILIEPMFLNKKIYIFDEIQVASQNAQTRLLKTCEEIPKYACIILCTTHPDKILPTLKDRCRLKIHVKKAKEEDLVNRLLYICKQEGIKTSVEALKLLIKHAERNPRKAIISLEEIARGYNFEVTLETIRKATGAVASEIYMEFYRAANKGLEEILHFTRSLKERDIAPRDFIKGLTSFTLDCINVKFGIGLGDYPLEYINQIKEFFSIYNTEDIDTLLQIIEYAVKMMSNDDSSGDLIINTTAMRIGKIKLLSAGLQNELEAAVKETQAGNKKSIQKLREEERNTPIVAAALDSSLMVATFGANVKEVKTGIKLGVTEEDEVDRDSRMMTDEDLLEMFGQ
mgnify:FL=1